MRIGIALSGLRPVDGGGHTFQQELISEIERAPGAHEYVVFDLGDGVHEPQAAVPRINVRSAFRGSRVSRMYRNWRRIGRRLGVVSSAEEASALERAVQAYRIDVVWYLAPFDHKVSVPYVCTVWDLQHRLQPWFPEVSRTGCTWQEREKLYRALLPRATLILTGTEVGRQEALHFYAPAPGNVRVLPLPTPVFRDPGEPSGDMGRLVQYGLEPGFLFYPAQFWPHKNHVNLLRALALLNRDREKPLRLVLTGSDKGNRAYVLRVIAKLGLSDVVCFPGFVPERDLVALYRQASALVFPSFFGPDNLPPLEAFSLGCPVAAAAVDGAKEQLGECALLFDPRDPESIADTVRRIVDDDGLSGELRRRGFERAAAWTAADYVLKMRAFFDDFESVCRCWEAGYEQTD